MWSMRNDLAATAVVDDLAGAADRLCLRVRVSTRRRCNGSA